MKKGEFMKVILNNKFILNVYFIKNHKGEKNFRILRNFSKRREIEHCFKQL